MSEVHERAARAFIQSVRDYQRNMRRREMPVNVVELSFQTFVETFGSVLEVWPRRESTELLVPSEANLDTHMLARLFYAMDGHDVVIECVRSRCFGYEFEVRDAAGLLNASGGRIYGMHLRANADSWVEEWESQGGPFGPSSVGVMDAPIGQPRARDHGRRRTKRKVEF